MASELVRGVSLIDTHLSLVFCGLLLLIGLVHGALTSQSIFWWCWAWLCTTMGGRSFHSWLGLARSHSTKASWIRRIGSHEIILTNESSVTPYVLVLTVRTKLVQLMIVSLLVIHMVIILHSMALRIVCSWTWRSFLGRSWSQWNLLLITKLIYLVTHAWSTLLSFWAKWHLLPTSRLSLRA